jgi:hypothetical protein
MSHFDKAESIATNTLLIPEIPLCFFGCDDAMLMIHDAFAEFGPIYTFVPMKGFRRLMIIFQETAHAMKAKKSLDRHTLVWKEKQPFPDIITLTILENDQDKAVWEQHRLFELRVYYGQVRKDLDRMVFVSSLLTYIYTAFCYSCRSQISFITSTSIPKKPAHFATRRTL